MEIKKLETACGAPLYVAEMPHAKSIATGVLVQVGTRDEKWPDEAGLAHAFEHMVFKGTEKFPNSKSLSSHIEDVGGTINAWTWKETTFFFNHVPVGFFDRAITVLHQMLTAPLFNPRRVSAEMKNIIEEIKRRDDEPRTLIQDLAMQAVFGTHPYAYDTLGHARSLVAFTSNDFQRFKEQFYHPGNFIFLVTGNVTSAQALETINRLCWGSARVANNRQPAICGVGGVKLKIVFKDIAQANICLVTLVGGSKERSTLVLDLFATMLDGGMSFPLFQKVRGKLGLCYQVGASVSSLSDGGFFIIYVGTDVQRWQTTVDAILSVVVESAKNYRLFLRAKKSTLGHLATGGYETPLALLRKSAMDLSTLGRPESIEENMAAIKSISYKEVQEAVARYIIPEKFSKIFVVPKGFSMGS